MRTEQEGLTLGNYRLGALLGRGGMGDVYRAEHVRLGREAAIKLVAPALRDDPEFVKRFLREARLLARLDHPNVVRVFDCGVEGDGGEETDDGLPYLVMELLEGETLRERLRRGPLDEAEAVRVARGVLAGLACAHRAQVVHRDVKPGNIFLCKADGDGPDAGELAGAVKLMDFGIAKAAADGHTHVSRLTEAGAQIGTAEYMSPEQADGREVDARSDLYAAGIVLYQMLTGRVPFTGESALAVLNQQVHKAPPPLPASISPWLRKVVERALAKKPASRYQSAEEMLKALESGVPRRAVAEPPDQPTKAKVRPEAPPQPPTPKQKLPVGAIAAAVVCMALAGGALVVRNRSRNATPHPGSTAPGRAVERANAAYQLLTRHKFDEAESAAQEAITLDPKNANAHAALGTAILEDSVAIAPDGATRAPASINAELVSALASDPSNARAKAAIARLGVWNATSAYHRWKDVPASASVEVLGRLAECRKNAREALQTEPRLAYGHYVLGLINSYEEQWTDAEAELKQALSLDAGMAWVRTALASVYYLQSRYAEAKAQIDAERDNRTDDERTRSLESAVKLAELIYRRAGASAGTGSQSSPSGGTKTSDSSLSGPFRWKPVTGSSPSAPSTSPASPQSTSATGAEPYRATLPGSLVSSVPQYRNVTEVEISSRMPRTPEKRSISLGGTSWVYDSSGVRYIMTVWTVPTKDSQTAEKVMRTVGRDWTRSTVLSEKPLTLGSSIPGKELRYQNKEAKGPKGRLTVARYYAVGQGLFQVAVSVPAGKELPSDADAFLSSFELKMK